MNDANGGEGHLNGIVQNVPLNCGSIVTHTNLYVGDKVPFDLLLGRPWQHGNFISIDERREGTYLLFKDPKSLEARYEVLVTPDSDSPVDWNFDPSTWLTQEAPTSYFVNIDQEIKKPDGIWALRSDKIKMERSVSRDFSHTHAKFSNITPIQNMLADEVIRHASHLLLKMEDLESIKERKLNNEKPHICPPDQLLSKMAMHLGPARVQHESELPSLFSSPTSTRTEAECLLMGRGDLTHFGNNHLSHQIIASSGSGVIVGHLPD
jgi:hypothetical protein